MRRSVQIHKYLSKWKETSLNALRIAYENPYLPTIGVSIIWIAGMVVTALVTFPNHYNFRTYGYDLGYVAGMLENLSRGKYLARVYYSNEIVPHISYAVYILGLPFYWLGGVWGILAYQWIGIGLGAWGVYAYSRQKIGSLAWLSMLHYWGMWGIYGALAFDVHPDVVGVCFVPWIFYALESKKKVLLYTLTLTASLSKHTISIWLIFIFAFLYFYYRSGDVRKRYSLYAFLVSMFIALASFALNSYFEQSLSGISRFTSAYRYLWSDNPLNPTYYATGFTEKIRYIIKNWYYLWVFLWESPHLEPAYVGIKAEAYLSILLSGGWAFICMPILIIPIIPIAAYKSLASDYQAWGTLLHYGMEYAVYIPMAYAIWLSTLSGSRKVYLTIAGVLLTHLWNFYLMENRVSKWYQPEQMIWYTRDHYTSPYDYKRIHKGLAIIPETSYVMAVSRILPHLPPEPGRHFHIGFCDTDVTEEKNQEDSPVCIDPRTEYIVLLRSESNPWPVGIQAYHALIEYLRHSPRWRLVYDKDNLLIFQRKSPQNAQTGP